MKIRAGRTLRTEDALGIRILSADVATWCTTKRYAVSQYRKSQGVVRAELSTQGAATTSTPKSYLKFVLAVPPETLGARLYSKVRST